MAADNRDGLAAATRTRSQETRAQARAALRRLDRDGMPVTFASVAAAAGVSRSLLYRDPTLRTEVERLRTARPASRRPPATERSTDTSLNQRLAAALDDNHALRHENSQLRDQLAALLGQQRTADTASATPSRAIGPCS